MQSVTIKGCNYFKPDLDESWRNHEGIVMDNFLNVVLAMPNMTNEELINAQSENIKMGYYNYKGLMIFLHKFGEMPWSLCCYNFKIQPVEIPKDDKAFALTFNIWDTASMILKHYRRVSISRWVSSQIKADIKAGIYPDRDAEFLQIETLELVKRATTWKPQFDTNICPFV